MWELIRRIYGGTLIALFVFFAGVSIAYAIGGVLILRDAADWGEMFVGYMALVITFGYGYFAMKIGREWYAVFG